MKKAFVAAALLGASVGVQANAPGGPGCGWGNMLFEGQSGLPSHLSATIVDGTSGNATFGMTSGTNGCDTSVPLAYHGASFFAQTGMMEEVARDTAAGDGEALTALSVTMGVAPEDRAHFKQVMHENFDSLFAHEDVTAGEVMQVMTELMERDERLASYV